MPQPDCDRFFSPMMCKGKMHEGKACYWDFEVRKCIESNPGDPEHVCASLVSADECSQHPMCRWQLFHCVQFSDYEPMIPPFFAQFFQNQNQGQNNPAPAAPAPAPRPFPASYPNRPRPRPGYHPHMLWDCT
eukprot:UN01207